jgi:hypothetical protein
VFVILVFAASEAIVFHELGDDNKRGWCALSFHGLRGMRGLARIAKAAHQQEAPHLFPVAPACAVAHAVSVRAALPAPRYADVAVHRLLAASLRLAALPEQSCDAVALSALTNNLNTRHRNAQMAGRASVELHTLIFFKDRAVVADARVTKVTHGVCARHHPVIGLALRDPRAEGPRCLDWTLVSHAKDSSFSGGNKASRKSRLRRRV